MRDTEKLECDCCNHSFDASYGEKAKDGRFFCSEDCAKNLDYVSVSCCNEYVHVVDALEIDNAYFCDGDCAEKEGYVLTECCNTYELEEDVTEYDSSYYCNSDCMKKKGILECDECCNHVYDGDVIEVDDNSYCSKSCCESDGNLFCSYCDEYFKARRYNYVYAESDDVYFCDTLCAERSDYFECDCCKNYFSNRDSQFIEVSGYKYCNEKCAEEAGYVPCSECGDYLDPDIGVKASNKYFCGASCVRYDNCKGCCEPFDIDDLFYYNKEKDICYCTETCMVEDGFCLCSKCDLPSKLNEVYKDSKNDKIYCKNCYKELGNNMRMSYNVGNMKSKLNFHDKKYISDLQNTDVNKAKEYYKRYSMLYKSGVLENLGYFIFNNEQKNVPQFALVKNNKVYIVSISSLLIFDKSKQEIFVIYDFSKDEDYNKIRDLISKGFTELKPLLYVYDLRTNISKYIHLVLES